VDCTGITVPSDAAAYFADADTAAPVSAAPGRSAGALAAAAVTALALLLA
jgi:hypothetical protein